MMCWLLRWCLKIYSNAVANVSKRRGRNKVGRGGICRSNTDLSTAGLGGDSRLA